MHFISSSQMQNTTQLQQPLHGEALSIYTQGPILILGRLPASTDFGVSSEQRQALTVRKPE